MKITKVKVLANYQLEVEFDDQAHGIVNLADLSGKGVFRTWLTPGIFEQVQITEDGALTWPGDLDLCSDALYLRMTGKAPEDIFPSLRHQYAHA